MEAVFGNEFLLIFMLSNRIQVPRTQRTPTFSSECSRNRDRIFSWPKRENHGNGWLTSTKLQVWIIEFLSEIEKTMTWKILCIKKGFVTYRLSHDCHMILIATLRPRTAASSLGDSVDLLSRTICTTVVVSDWCVTWTSLMFGGFPKHCWYCERRKLIPQRSVVVTIGFYAVWISASSLQKSQFHCPCWCC